jgi:hypothetical protein
MNFASNYAYLPLQKRARKEPEAKEEARPIGEEALSSEEEDLNLNVFVVTF